MHLKPFETHSTRMQPMYLLTVQLPAENADTIIEHVTTITPLTAGKYDCNSYETAPGFERYRPGEGAAAGKEEAIRKRPGVVILYFQIEDDEALLANVVEKIFAVNPYQEPFITVERVLVSRSKGLDDSKNPYRWWNTTGDWKKAS
ncbi:MAG: hypothetical protein LCH46_02640 [Proteobacteria bacterium]|nr:hypothetical protein [Pseudomonadota bacterium]